MAKTPKTTKKNAIATKWFVQPDGTLSKYPTVETTALRFIFADEVEIDSTREDDGEGMAERYYWHGKSQKFGDGYAGAKTPEEARDGGEKCQGLVTLQERAADGE